MKLFHSKRCVFTVYAVLITYAVFAMAHSFSVRNFSTERVFKINFVDAEKGDG